MGEFFINEEYFWVNEENFGMMWVRGWLLAGGNGICGGKTASGPGRTSFVTKRGSRKVPLVRLSGLSCQRFRFIFCQLPVFTIFWILSLFRILFFPKIERMFDFV